MEIFSSASFWIIVLAVMCVMAFIGYMIENTEFAKKALSKDFPAPKRKVQEVRKPLTNDNNQIDNNNINQENKTNSMINNNTGAIPANNQNNVPSGNFMNSFNELPQIYTEGEINPLNVNDSMDPWSVGNINDLNLSDKPDVWNVGEIHKLKVRDPDYEPNAWTDGIPKEDTRKETYYNAEGNDIFMNEIKDDSGNENKFNFLKNSDEVEILSFGDDDPFANKES